MLLSHEHKFIYVKGRKVASTSIEISLSPFCGPSDIVTPITPADELHRLSIGGKSQNFSHDTQLEARYLQLVRDRKFKEAGNIGVHSPHPSRFYNHMPLADIEARLTLPYNEYSVVISERNPYAKIISLANMRLSFSDYRGEAMENAVDDIRRSIGDLFHNDRFRIVRNISLYQTKNPYKDLVVIRQENLASDLAQLFSQLGLGKGLDHWPHAKKGPANQRLDPAIMFTREQLDLVNLEFADEFETFGYERI